MMDVYSDTRQWSLYSEDMIRRLEGSHSFVAGQAPEFGTLVSRLTAKIVDGVARWIRRNRIELELNALSDHMLEDIGVERWQIKEIAKTFASSEVRRERIQRQAVKAARILEAAEAAKAARIKPYIPAIAAPIVSVAVANDDQRNIAA